MPDTRAEPPVSIIGEITRATLAASPHAVSLVRQVMQEWRDA
jgi:hypothetical protein